MTIQEGLKKAGFVEGPKRPKGSSHPRCCCHNFYLDKCPDIKPGEAKRVTDLMTRISRLDVAAVTLQALTGKKKPWEKS